MWSLLCIPSLAALAMSDLRSRRVGVMCLAVLGITILTTSLIELGWRRVTLDAGCNLLIVFLLWLLLCGYAHLRKMRLPEMIGGGDLAFALMVSPYFAPEGYVRFLVVTSLLTLAVWWLSGIRGERCRDIPLVTGMAVSRCGDYL